MSDGLDTTKLSTLALDLIERLAEDHAGRPTEVGMVALVVEINGEYQGDQVTWVEYRCTDTRRWVQVGLFQAAERAVLNA